MSNRPRTPRPDRRTNVLAVLACLTLLSCMADGMEMVGDAMVEVGDAFRDAGELLGDGGDALTPDAQAQACGENCTATGAVRQMDASSDPQQAVAGELPRWVSDETTFESIYGDGAFFELAMGPLYLTTISTSQSERSIWDVQFYAVPSGASCSEPCDEGSEPPPSRCHRREAAPPASARPLARGAGDIDIVTGLRELVRTDEKLCAVAATLSSESYGLPVRGSNLFGIGWSGYRPYE